jgi:hypothetical protein
VNPIGRRSGFWSLSDVQDLRKQFTADIPEYGEREGFGGFGGLQDD